MLLVSEPSLALPLRSHRKREAGWMNVEFLPEAEVLHIDNGNKMH
jgi:hypothetical protein